MLKINMLALEVSVLVSAESSSSSYLRQKQTLIYCQAVNKLRTHNIVHKMQYLPNSEGFSPILHILFPSELFDSNIQRWYFRASELVEDKAASCL